MRFLCEGCIYRVFTKDEFTDFYIVFTKDVRLCCMFRQSYYVSTAYKLAGVIRRKGVANFGSQLGKNELKGGFQLVRIWSHDPCDRSRPVARTSRTAARPMA